MKRCIPSSLPLNQEIIAFSILYNHQMHFFKISTLSKGISFAVWTSYSVMQGGVLKEICPRAAYSGPWQRFQWKTELSHSNKCQCWPPVARWVFNLLHTIVEDWNSQGVSVYPVKSLEHTTRWYNQNVNLQAKADSVHSKRLLLWITLFIHIPSVGLHPALPANGV